MEKCAKNLTRLALYASRMPTWWRVPLPAHSWESRHSTGGGATSGNRTVPGSTPSQSSAIPILFLSAGTEVENRNLVVTLRVQYFFNSVKKFRRMNGPTILDGLHNSRCGSFCCVRVNLIAAKICMVKHKDFIMFYILARIKHNLELQYHFYRNSRSRGNPYSVIVNMSFP